VYRVCGEVWSPLRKAATRKKLYRLLHRRTAVGSSTAVALDLTDKAIILDLRLKDEQAYQVKNLFSLRFCIRRKRANHRFSWAKLECLPVVKVGGLWCVPTPAASPEPQTPDPQTCEIWILRWVLARLTRTGKYCPAMLWTYLITPTPATRFFVIGPLER